MYVKFVDIRVKGTFSQYMRRSGRWMTIWDDRILEVIREEGSGSPKKLKESGYIRVSRTHISRRLRELANHGMLQHLGNGVYVITELGEDYLDGELDADELEEVGGEEGTADA